MNNKRIFKSAALLISVLFFSIVIGYITTNKVVDLIPNSINLKVNFVGEFPTEDIQIVIGSVIEMASSDKDIYILDQRRSMVHQFDLSGNFIRSISKPGPGPGELQLPLSISYSNDHLYTFEQSKMQVQKFSEDGIYRDVFIFQGAYEELTVVNNKLWMTNHYFPNLPSFMDMPNSDEQPIYTIFDIHTMHLVSTGSYPEIMFERNKIGTTKTTAYQGNIYTLFRSLLKINVYDGNTTDLIQTIILNGGIFDQARNAVLNDYDNQILSVMNLVVNQYGLFIPVHGSELAVYRFNLDGELISKISFEDHYETEFEDRYIRHIHIKETENLNELRFYLKVYSDYPRILIFDTIIEN